MLMDTILDFRNHLHCSTTCYCVEMVGICYNILPGPIEKGEHMPESEVDLAKLFNQVTEVLQGEKDSLNEADSYNHDHGDHMVENFKLITEALEQRQGASPAEQLAYASEVLGQSSNTGSARSYSEGLFRAANQLQGQPTIT